jgi:hypothetical protein
VVAQNKPKHIHLVSFESSDDIKDEKHNNESLSLGQRKKASLARLMNKIIDETLLKEESEDQERQREDQDVAIRAGETVLAHHPTTRIFVC